jgi:glycosyltransferase involved in cell wall biosynthesis
MSKTIISAATSDLFTDQRVLKTAYTLYNQGYNITVTGRLLNNRGELNVPFKSKRFKLHFNKGFLFYAEYNIRLFIFLLFSKVDIILSNDTDTLPACYLASKIRNKELVFDAHELFPEMAELQNRHFVKKFWAFIEEIIFPHLKHSYTVSTSIADYYRKKYGINMQLVRNVPYLKNNETPKTKSLNFGDKKIILYQGALNTGRGIEWILNAMPLIPNAVFVLIGDGDIKKELIQLTADLQITDRVKFLGIIPADELQNYTTSADLGVCLLENKGLSYYYSLPNRIFAFMHAKVPVLATDFPEIRKIVEKYRTGIVISENKPEIIADKILEMLSTPFSTDHFTELAAKFCWEKEEKIIIELFKKI